MPVNIEVMVKIVLRGICRPEAPDIGGDGPDPPHMTGWFHHVTEYPCGGR
jgi:hypothetical protein